MKVPHPVPSSARRVAALVLLQMALATDDAIARRWDEDDIRRMIVEDSIARYGGDCPCPYSYAWNGKQCANDSAYMKRTADAPYCYPKDVPPYEVYRYRRERGL